MAEAKFYVYVHRQADTGDVFYVGKGAGRRAWSKSGRNKHWHNVTNKHGRTVQIVADCLLEREAFTHERALIASLRGAQLRIVNLTDGGDGVSGFKRAPDTEETRAKRRASAIGRRMSPEAIEKTAASRRGKPLPAETVEKIKATLKGRATRPPLAPETVARIAEGNKGRRHSEEVRAKMSAVMRGKKKRPQSPEHRAKIAQKRKEYWERWRAAPAATT